MTKTLEQEIDGALQTGDYLNEDIHMKIYIRNMERENPGYLDKRYNLLNKAFNEKR